MSYPHLDESIFRAELEQNGDSTWLKGTFLVVVDEATALLFDRSLEDCLFILDGCSLGDEPLACIVKQEGLYVREERTAPSLQGIKPILHSIFSYGHEI